MASGFRVYAFPVLAHARSMRKPLNCNPGPNPEHVTCGPSSCEFVVWTVEGLESAVQWLKWGRSRFGLYFRDLNSTWILKPYTARLANASPFVQGSTFDGGP